MLDLTAHELDEKPEPTTESGRLFVFGSFAEGQKRWGRNYSTWDVVLAIESESRLQGDPGLLREATCLTCGATIPDPTAGACHECGAEDRWIGSQWLSPSFPRDVLPFAATPTEPEAIDVERLARAIKRVAVKYHDQLHSKPSVWEDRPEWVADWIAAEYARLSNPAQRETER